MTVPNERRNSIKMAREFLWSLLDPKKTPKVPRAIRKQARSVLRHFPGELDMKIARVRAPGVFGEWDSKG